MGMFPSWLDALCTVSLAHRVVSALSILIDVLRHPPHMAIMRIVWPECALFGTVCVAWLYFCHGREIDNPANYAKKKGGHVEFPGKSQPFPLIVAEGTLHCGGGCTLGDILAEWLAFVAPTVAIAFGWHSLFAEKTYAVWILDFIVAYALGIVFQYFAIVPMRKLSASKGIVAALKADTLSLAAWQIGMYCLMAVLQFTVFKRAFGGKAPVDSVEFWGVMQLAMTAGFCTSYPVNWWLIRVGIKERM